MIKFVLCDLKGVFDSILKEDVRYRIFLVNENDDFRY